MSNFYRERVLSGKEKVARVFENERFLAFEHTKPAYQVHIVVIPKLEIDALLDFPEDAELALEMIRVLKQVSLNVVKDHGSCRVLTNLGEYQDSKHLHWHMISGNRL